VRARALLKELAAELGRAGIPEPEKEAELILTAASGVDRVSLYRDDPEPATRGVEQARAMAARRGQREPLAYILGRAEFYGLPVAVGPGVLVPRPETELLVDVTLKRLNLPGEGLRLLDLCTGSGCLAAALARHLPSAMVVASDASARALRFARETVELNGLENVELREGNLFKPVAGERFDAIVSNPPYVRTGDIEGLEPEISRWEPREALDGGADGLGLYHAIMPEAPEHLVPGGLIVLEMGLGQAGAVSGLAREAGFSDVSLLRDYCGVERVLLAGRP
jgi:release factor glutamine methyltransferase